MKLSDILLGLFAVVIWGINFSIIKLGLVYMPPLLFSALRFAVVAIPAIFFVPFPRLYWKEVVGVGVFLGIFKFGFLFFAIESGAPAGLSSLLVQCHVFITILICSTLWKERINRQQYVGLVLSILGVTGLVLANDDEKVVLALSFVLAAAFFWACSNVIMKRLKNVKILHFIIWASVVPPLPLLAASLAVESWDGLDWYSIFNKNSILALAYVGYLSTLVAFSIWGRLLTKYSAVTVSPLALLVPVIGMLSAFLIFGERINYLEMGSASLIIAGLAVCILPFKLNRD